MPEGTEELVTSILWNYDFQLLELNPPVPQAIKEDIDFETNWSNYAKYKLLLHIVVYLVFCATELAIAEII